jgi:NAD(P) transhydrogenase subunit beta
MPIFNADQAHAVMLFKHGHSPGFSGEDNKLFHEQKTMMIFGNARAALMSLIQLFKRAAVA